MDRIRDLDRYQKAILLILAVMLVVFTVLYAVISSRVGFDYMDTILRPSYDQDNTTYSGEIHGQTAVFTVTADKTVTFTYGDRTYGPYTAKKDPTAIPEGKDYMTGVEIRCGEDVFFRGGVIRMQDGLMLIDEDGNFSSFSVTVFSSNGTVVDYNGNVIDQMKPSAHTVLTLMDGPQLTSKGEWALWFMAVFISAATAVSILFAEELFRWNLSFRIRDAYRAEPSDWEVAQRYIAWTAMPVMALVFYIRGIS